MTCSAKSCANSLMPVPKTSRLTPHERQTWRRAPSPSSWFNLSSTLQSSHLSLVCATRWLANTYEVSAYAVASFSKKRSISRKPASPNAPRASLLLLSPLRVTRQLRHLQNFHKAPRRQEIIRNHYAMRTPQSQSLSTSSKVLFKFGAPQSDWRAANPDNTAPPPMHVYNFDFLASAPFSSTSNQYETNEFSNTGVYVTMPFLYKQPLDFFNILQPLTYQHKPRPQFQQPRWKCAPYTPSQTKSYAVPPLKNTFFNPMPLAHEQQHSPSQHFNRSSSIVHKVKSAGRDTSNLQLHDA